MEHEALQRAFFDVMHRWGKSRPPAVFIGITQGEFFVLELLVRHKDARPDSEGMHVSRLVNHLHVSGPAVSRTLRLLEEKNCIERYVDKADRRNTYITITKEGNAAWERAAENLGLFIRSVIDRMGHQEMVDLIGLWNRLVDAVNEVGGESIGRE